MTLVLPILLFSIAVGLFVRRMTPGVWLLLTTWIGLVIAFYWLKH